MKKDMKLSQERRVLSPLLGFQDPSETRWFICMLYKTRDQKMLLSSFLSVFDIELHPEAQGILPAQCLGTTWYWELNTGFLHLNHAHSFLKTPSNFLTF